MKRLIPLLFLALASAALRADSIDAAFPASPRFPVFAAGTEVGAAFHVKRDDPSVVTRILWSVRDYRGTTVRQGTLSLPAGGPAETDVPLALSGLPSGYLELRAALGGAALPRHGSRPPGLASFGILPPLAAPALADPAQGRFGIQGTTFLKTGVRLQGDAWDPLYSALGVRWVNDSVDWKNAEPDRPGEYAERPAPAPGAENAFAAHGFAPLATAFNLPAWAIDEPPGAAPDPKDTGRFQAYPPKDMGLYSAYLREMASRRAALWAGTGTKALYYQFGWEPDWHWKGTDAQFLALYGAAAKAIRAGDPGAVVLGPNYGVLAKGVALLERLLPQGLGQSLDGVTVHGYYVPFGNPNAADPEGKLISPEDGGTIENLRKLRALMKRWLKPGAKLFQTEWGLDYRGAYKDLDPALLRIQAAYIIRGHLIFLGEGCDVTYFFYAADYGNLETRGEDGYGLCFNLTMPKPSTGAIDVSPKPVFMAGCALTRLVDGSVTRGPVPLGNDAVCAYAFQRAGSNVVALWSRDGVARDVRVPVGADAVTLVDFMGNPRPLSCPGNAATVSVGEEPVYLQGVADAVLPPL